MKTVKIRPESSPTGGLVRAFASNRATLLLLGLLALAITLYYQLSPRQLWIIALPTGLLIANFLLALATRDILKNNWPLMVFHFALIALVLLAFAGQLSFFKATLELSENEEFSGRLENVRQGPWHRYGLSTTRFTNLGFRIRYNAGIKRDKTVNRLLLAVPGDLPRTLEIGDHVPLVIGHYRFYTSHNKGFAPVFQWRPADGSREVVGSIHLPAYPTNEFGQALQWTVPGTDIGLWAFLKIEEDLLPADRAFEFQVPRRHQLVVRHRDQRHALRPGDELELPGGVLRYLELSTWMGYKVDYDWTRPWLLASALIGLLGLFTHFVVKFNRPLARRAEDGEARGEAYS